MEKTCEFRPCGRPREGGNRSIWCSGHRGQRKRGKEMTPIAPRMTQLERFWSKVDQTDTCWKWASTKRFGYGQFQTGGRNAPKLPSHKFAYELVNGPVPEGKILDHVCHDRSCVNPGHLRLVNSKQNNENRGVVNKNNKSTGVRGVTRVGSKFVGQVMHNRRNHFVGRFESLAEAESAVIEKRNELFTHNDLDRIAA